MIEGIATFTIVASTMIMATPIVSATRPSQREAPPARVAAVRGEASVEVIAATVDRPEGPDARGSPQFRCGSYGCVRALRGQGPPRGGPCRSRRLPDREARRRLPVRVRLVGAVE